MATSLVAPSDSTVPHSAQDPRCPRSTKAHVGSQHIAASAVRPKIEIGRYTWVAIACGDPATKDHNMSNDNSLSLPELNNRIAILQNNIRQLVQQAAGSAGARDEERISDRIARQNEELEKLTKERDALLKR